MIRLTGIVFIFALWVSPPAPAATLSQALDAALQRQPGVSVAESQLAESHAIDSQASSLFARDPNFSLEHFNDSVGSGDGVTEWDAALEMPMWMPGQRGERHAVADAAAAQAGAFTQTRRWETAGQLRERLWAILLAEAHHQYLETALADARRTETAIARRVKAGDMSRSDLLLAQQETLNRNAEVLRARADLDAAHHQWQLLTGMDEVPSDFREPEAPATAIGDHHPGLSAALADFRRAMSDRDRVRGERRAPPVLSLGGRRERGPRGEPWDDAMSVGISIPFGLASQNAPALAAADVDVARADDQLATRRKQLEEDLVAARSELSYARQALAAAREADQLAGESLKLLEKSFDVGETDVFRLLQVRAQALDAAWNLKHLELEVGRDTAMLNQALGVLPQ